MKLIKYICIFIFSITACAFCMKTPRYNYEVPGTVVYKNTEQYAHGKHNRNMMSTRYIMRVKPNDTNKFKHYSMCVDHTTYCTHNVGDKISFSVPEKKCLRDFKRSIWIEKFSCIMLSLFIVLSIFSFVGMVIVTLDRLTLEL